MTSPKERIRKKYIELLEEIVRVQKEFLEIYGFTEEFEIWSKSWKDEICENCKVSFIPEIKNQTFCMKCLKIAERILERR